MSLAYSSKGALVLFGGSVVRTEHDKTAPHARVFFNIPLDVTLPKVVGYCACTSSLVTGFVVRFIRLLLLQ